MHPDDVLRKGSGTLCEALLMVEAFNGSIIFPNKQGQSFGKMYEGHLIDSETYVGGHVEALQVGVYRADIDTEFEVDATELQVLMDDTEKILRFAVHEEARAQLAHCINFEETKQQLHAQLSKMRDAAPHIKTTPLIYHVDVAAMYPNIILTNRLQPVAIVDGTSSIKAISFFFFSFFVSHYLSFNVQRLPALRVFSTSLVTTVREKWNGSGVLNTCPPNGLSLSTSRTSWKLKCFHGRIPNLARSA